MKRKRLSAAEQRRRSTIRRAVWERDGCCRLAHHSQCFGKPTVHHRRKASQGGEFSEANLAALCSHHNDQLEADADLAAYARSIGLVLKTGDAA